MSICCVKGCGKHQYPGCGLHFHRIPVNEELKEKWLKVIPRKGNLSDYTKVCSNHFNAEDYTSIYACDHKFRKLRQGAVPSIFPEVEESNPSDTDENSVDEKLEVDNEVPKTLTENETNKVILVTPKSEGKKMLELRPITTINKIEDVITIKPLVSGENTGSSSTIKTAGTSGMVQVSLLYSALTQKQGNNIINVKPKSAKEKVSTKNITNSDDSDDISSVNESSDSDNSSDDEKHIVPVRAAIFIKEASPERTLKRKHEQGVPIDMFGRKVPRISALDATESNEARHISNKPIKCHVATQTGSYTTPREQDLKKKVKDLKQKINRRITAIKQFKTLIDLIKTKCTNYTEVKEVLSLKLRQLPENLNCDGIIIAP